MRARRCSRRCARRACWRRGAAVVAMLSGGRDSVCLLDLGGPPARGRRRSRRCTSTTGCATTPTRTSASASRFASGSGCALEVERPRRPEGPGNLQAWARDARYAAAARLAARAAAALIATGHTADDQVETILYRLASSPSRRALLGMRRARRQAGPAAARLHPGARRPPTARSAGSTWRDDPTNDERRLRAQPGPPRARRGARRGPPGGGAQRAAHRRAAARRGRGARRAGRRRARRLQRRHPATRSSSPPCRAAAGAAPARRPAARRPRRRAPGRRRRQPRRRGRRPAPHRHRDARPRRRRPRRRRAAGCCMRSVECARGCAVLAAIVLAALFAAGPASAAGHPGHLPIGAKLSVRSSNGYVLTIGGSGKDVSVAVTSKRAAAVYVATAGRVTADSIRAWFGHLGVIDLAFYPRRFRSGRPRHRRASAATSPARREYRTGSSWGRSGSAARAATPRSRRPTPSAGSLRCRASRCGLVGPPMPSTASRALPGGRPPSARWPSPAPGSPCSGRPPGLRGGRQRASITLAGFGSRSSDEPRSDTKPWRSAGWARWTSSGSRIARGGRGSYDFSESPRNLEVSPPPPFSGVGRYRSCADQRWSGSLAVSLPGAGRIGLSNSPGGDSFAIANAVPEFHESQCGVIPLSQSRLGP